MNSPEQQEEMNRYKKEEREFNALAFETFVASEAGALWLKKMMEGMRDAPALDPSQPGFENMLKHQNGFKAVFMNIKASIKEHEKLLLKGEHPV